MAGAPATATATGTIPDLATVSVRGYDVLMPGRYVGIKGGANSYTAEDLEGIAQAHDELKDIIRPVAKTGHGNQKLWQDAEMPNSGNITRAYIEGGRLKVDLDDVPAKIGALMKAGNLPARSAELLFNVTHNGKTYPKVLTGLALLGESLPAVRGLNDVLARYQSGDSTDGVLLSAGDVDEITLAAAATKSEGDAGDFPASDYAYVPDPEKSSTWKLRLTAKPGGAPDAGMVGAAAAALGAGFRGEKVDIPDADRAAVLARVRAAWTKANPDKKAADMPKAIALAAAEPKSDTQKAEEAAAACADPKHADMPPALHKKVHMPAKAALSQSLDEIRNAVEDALQDAYPDSDPYGTPLAADDDTPSAWIVQLLDDAVVVWDQDHDSYWRVPYTFDAASSAATLDTEGAKPCRLVPEVITGAELADATTPVTAGGGSIPSEPSALTTDYAPHLTAIQTHLSAVNDLLGKLAGKHGVGPARAMHRELSSKVAGLQKRLVPPDPNQHAAAMATAGAQMSASQEETMQDTEIRVLLNLPPEADVRQALIARQAQHVELADHQAALAERDAAVQERDALLSAKREGEAVALVDKAIGDGKVLPKMKGWAVNLAQSDRTSFEQFLASAPLAWMPGEIGRAGTDLGPTGEPANVSDTARQLAAELNVDPAALADTRTFDQKVAAYEAEKQSKQAAAVTGAPMFVKRS